MFMFLKRLCLCFPDIRYLDYGTKHHWLFEHNKRLWKYCFAGGWNKSVLGSVKFVNLHIGSHQNFKRIFFCQTTKEALPLFLCYVAIHMANY